MRVPAQRRGGAVTNSPAASNTFDIPITALVEAHREEFDGYLADLGETVSLADRRAANRQRRA
jgi:hypothetical protein